MATSLTGPEELLTSFAKGFVVTSLPLDLTKDFVISQFTPPFATCFVVSCFYTFDLLTRAACLF